MHFSPARGGRPLTRRGVPVPEVLTLVAGAITGAIMGLVFVTHAAILLVWDPPPRLAQRASTTGAGGLLMVASFVAFVVWQVIGIAAAVLFELMWKQSPTSIPAIPSVLYLLAVLFFSAMLAMPSVFILQGRARHVAFEFALVVGLFGFAIPFLVSSS